MGLGSYHNIRSNTGEQSQKLATECGILTSSATVEDKDLECSKMVDHER